MLQEIADEMSVKCDTDKIVQMFNAATWNSRNTGMIVMLMHGIIALEDKRVQPLTPELVQEKSVTDSVESENTQQGGGKD